MISTRRRYSPLLLVNEWPPQTINKIIYLQNNSVDLLNPNICWPTSPIVIILAVIICASINYSSHWMCCDLIWKLKIAIAIKLLFCFIYIERERVVNAHYKVVNAVGTSVDYRNEKSKVTKGTWKSASACHTVSGQEFWLDWICLHDAWTKLTDRCTKWWLSKYRNEYMLEGRQRGLATSNISMGELISKVFINWKEDKMWPFLSIDLITLKWEACTTASTLKELYSNYAHLW